MIYGLKQSAMVFWKQLLMCMKSMALSGSKADLCLYYTWTALGLAILVSWIDDNLIIGSQATVDHTKAQLMS